MLKGFREPGLLGGQKFWIGLIPLRRNDAISVESLRLGLYLSGGVFGLRGEVVSMRTIKVPVIEYPAVAYPYYYPYPYAYAWPWPYGYYYY
ncbi:MAG TPA: hypothetical protein VLV31_05905 [Candidatus Acidoferrales bacterium]|nr:hypothetical protein [Candidatus Acidoferrales bacterium]